MFFQYLTEQASFGWVFAVYFFGDLQTSGFWYLLVALKVLYKKIRIH